MGVLRGRRPDPVVPAATPAAAAPAAAQEAAAAPPPAPQASPTAQRGNAGNSAAQMAAGLGMNNTILTSPRGLAIPDTNTRTKTLLGL
jgi:hypothetical protein